MWISPTYQDSDFPVPHSIDTKITLFEDRALGWKLNIAEQIINGKKKADGSEERPPIQHSGFAVLDIVFSYFEMIAKYENGFTRLGKSERYFKLGVYSVFPEINQIPMPAHTLAPVGNVISIVDHVLDLMYSGIRCGLYHSGITNGRIMLTGEIQTPMAFDLQNQILIVNPHLLVPKLIAHLDEYLSHLKDGNNIDLRARFESRYDFDTLA